MTIVGVAALVLVTAGLSFGTFGGSAVDFPQIGVLYVDNQLSKNAAGTCVGNVITYYRQLELDYAFKIDFTVDSDCRVTPEWHWSNPLANLPRDSIHLTTVGSHGYNLHSEVDVNTICPNIPLWASVDFLGGPVEGPVDGPYPTTTPGTSRCYTGHYATFGDDGWLRLEATVNELGVTKCSRRFQGTTTYDYPCSTQVSPGYVDYALEAIFPTVNAGVVEDFPIDRPTV